MKALVIMAVVLFGLTGCIAPQHDQIEKVRKEVAAIIAEETDRAHFESRLRKLGAVFRPGIEDHEFSAWINLWKTPGGSSSLSITYFVDEKGRVTHASCTEVNLIVMATPGTGSNPTSA